jgi:hypothetical protein
MSQIRAPVRAIHEIPIAHNGTVTESMSTDSDLDGMRFRAYGSQVPLGLPRAAFAGLLFGVVGAAFYFLCFQYLLPVAWLGVLVAILSANQLVTYVLLSCTVDVGRNGVSLQWWSRRRDMNYSSTKLGGDERSVLLVPSTGSSVLLSAPWWSARARKQLSEFRDFVERRNSIASKQADLRAPN